MSLTRSSLLALTGLLALGTGLGPAAAADDGYQDVFSSVATAVGLMTPESSPEIDYRERAPLVLPPKMDLAKPSEALSRPASWPRDPDVARRRKAAADARAPSVLNLSGNVNQLLSKEELLKGRKDETPESAVRAAQCGSNGNARGCLVMSPDQLREEGERYAATNPDSSKPDLGPGQEPDRMYLTQPPKGYLKTTKAVKVTAEGPKIYHDESNPSAALVYRPKPDEE